MNDLVREALAGEGDAAHGGAATPCLQSDATPVLRPITRERTGLRCAELHLSFQMDARCCFLCGVTFLDEFRCLCGRKRFNFGQMLLEFRSPCLPAIPGGKHTPSGRPSGEVMWLFGHSVGVRLAG